MNSKSLVKQSEPSRELSPENKSLLQKRSVRQSKIDSPIKTCSGYDAIEGSVYLGPRRLFKHWEIFRAVTAEREISSP